MNALVGFLARQGVDPDLEMPRQMTRANPLHSHRNVSAPHPDGRIIHPVDVRDQRVEQRADLQKLMPIPAGARQ